MDSLISNSTIMNKASVFFILSFFFLIISCSEKNSQINNTKAICLVDQLRIRSDKNLDAIVIGNLNINDTVKLLENSEDTLSVTLNKNIIPGRWVKIQSADTTGWVFSGALHCINEKPISYQDTNMLLYIDINQNVNLLKSDKINSESIKTFIGPRYIEVVGIGSRKKCSNDLETWYQVKHYSGSDKKYFIQAASLISREKLMSNIAQNSIDLRSELPMNDEDHAVFWSEKEYENGDDGASWTEPSAFNLNIEDSTLMTGYMYTESVYNLIDAVKIQDKICLILAGSYDLKNITHILIEVLDDRSIYVHTYDDLSGKYNLENKQ
ncbi:MAG: hypothetical protein C0594_06340 [Marinilabiliales bacterium]|nr:MAG: hypothetical protein C0594_06340 [Marinilabiliales bacterium]